MDLSKIKMVVTDMDGTLLNSNHEVSERFFELFDALQSKQVLFVAASGRQYHSIVDKLEPIKDRIIVVAENGGYVKQKEEELLSTPLSTNYVNDTLKIFRDLPDTHPVLCGKNTAYLSGRSDAFVSKLKEYYSEFTIVDSLEDVKDEIIKVAIYHFNSSENYIYPHVKHLENRLQVKISGANWVDVSSTNANKGFAITQLMRRHNVLKDELMVFGDYNNDLEMLALTDFSFAMENAHLRVKQTANYQTESNDNFGVEIILEKLCAQLA